MAFIDRFRMKQNDTAPALAVTLLNVDADGIETPVNLTGATVVFHMRPRSGGVSKVTNGACVVTAAMDGEVNYPWQAGDTDTVGHFIGEFQVTFADGGVSTYPRTNYIPIVIGDDID